MEKKIKISEKKYRAEKVLIKRQHARLKKIKADLHPINQALKFIK